MQMPHVPSIDQELISYISYLSTKMDIHSDVGLWPILVEIHWAKCIYVFGMGWVCAEIGCRCVGKVVSDNDGGR